MTTNGSVESLDIFNREHLSQLGASEPRERDELGDKRGWVQQRLPGGDRMLGHMLPPH